MMLVVLFILSCYPFIVSSDSLPYAEWAHYHMVWLENSHSNQIDIQNMFNDYMNYNIQFGIVNIDSRWATNFNTFIFNPTTFPNIREMLDGFRAKKMHIVLWMTSMVNIDSPNYDYAQTHGYLFNKTLKWWHGNGRLLNYFNENAVNWWHDQIERLLDAVGPIHAFKVFFISFLSIRYVLGEEDIVLKAMFYAVFLFRKSVVRLVSPATK